MTYQILTLFLDHCIFDELENLLQGFNAKIVSIQDHPVGFERKTDLLIMDLGHDPVPSTADICSHFSMTPKLAVLCSHKPNRSLIYQAGFLDYLLHPFVKEEVLYRVMTSLLHPTAIYPRINLLSSAHDVQHQLIQKACDYMSANLEKRLTLASLAKQIGTSRTKLAALFQSKLNTTVFDWLREQRMLLADSLLQQSNLQIQQIAYAVGYDNPANFATTYRQHFQRSPSSRRKNGTQTKGIRTAAKAKKQEQV
jgi:AraC-like DNA-binding protein